MEYLHGEDLRAMLSVVSKQRTHMPLGTVVSVNSSVAAGLHYAHARHIVHRDVSPSNILVGYDGSVKIITFEITAEGRVEKSSVRTTLGKPDVSNCINLALRSFPKTGPATGVYSISFQ